MSMSWPLNLNETLDSILTIATLITIIFTAIAAQSAAVSAKITKNQFMLSKEQYDRQRVPHLIPIEQRYIRDKIGIHSAFDSQKFIYNGIGDLNIQIINVGIGNAYSIEAGIRIVNYDEIAKQISLKSPLLYEALVNQSYSLDFENLGNLNLIQYRVDKEDYKINEVNEHSFYVNNRMNFRTVLHSKETFSVGVSSFSQILLLDFVYRYFDSLDDLNTYVVPKLEIVIRYKAEEHLSKYNSLLTVYKVDVRDVEVDNYGRVSFRLIFSQTSKRT